MSRSVLLPFLAGVAVAVAIAILYPLPAHVRLASQISVEADGGRREDFLIRWPEDRIALPRDGDDRPAVAAAGAAVLEDSAGQRVSTEAFRLRDATGNVVGIATRTAAIGGSSGSDTSTSTWLLVVPARGALFLTQTDAADVSAREQVVNGTARVIAPAQTAAFWSGGDRYRITAGPRGEGTVLRGTDEFDGLRGHYTETWVRGPVNADGSAAGEIRLSTVTVRDAAP